ncbi:hypothetical protein QO058_30685 (plasmid) [Bosea vestrisii]|uniref:hypothetical protein n=1 Tax=Bosea vestrisii TaxID=151416 RepID=UPI0024DFCC44|nr:hypothetical protein [Bosea vestrisii]WID99762.1 hypothetical protein QO058_30685 [Bosea vestrisii]
MLGRGPVFYFVVASSLAVAVLACIVTIGRLVMPQEPVAQVAPQADAEAASRAMTFSSPKDPSR